MADTSRLGHFVKAVLAALFLAGASLAFSQNSGDLRESLFNETDKLLAQAQAEQANILSPDNFKNAMAKYGQASKDLQQKKGIQDIQKKLTQVRGYLKKCLDVAKLGHVTFETTLTAREDALKANATEFARKQYDGAEMEFLSAAKKLERNDVRGARKKIPKIETLFRQAELTAIKVSIIGSVKNLMQEAREVEAGKYAPITYANARKLLNEAESILNSNRRSESSAQAKAEQAEVEARHAIFLTREIRRLKKNDKEWENFLLDREGHVKEAAKAIGFDAQFDDGIDKPLKNIQEIGRILQSEKRDLLQEVTEKNQRIADMQRELQAYREKERGLQAELQEKQYKLELKRRRDEMVKSVETMFPGDKAIVLRKGEDIIIRLIGLTFPSGKATIKPEFFSVLATLQRALRKFTTSPITIEGHTDSIGDDRYNENLSYERAMAVKQYLLANMGLQETRITALGYGETRPIASNENNRGRAQNRRIDVVIGFSQTDL